MRRSHLLAAIVLGLAILVACGPMPASPPEAMEATSMPAAVELTATPAAETMMVADPTATESAMLEGEAPMPPVPEWMAIPLSDVVAGQQFRFSDFRGKVVLLETMAVWCTKCRALQNEIVKVRQDLGDQADDLVVVSIDVDPHEDEEYLRAYVDQAGFDWSFAIAPADLSRALAETYGEQFLNPPSTPLLLIDRDGAAQALPFGPKNAADILNALQPLLEGGM